MSRTFNMNHSLNQNEDIKKEYDIKGNLTLERYDNSTFSKFPRLDLDNNKEIVADVLYERPDQANILSLCIVDNSQNKEVEISLDDNGIPHCCFIREFDKTGRVIKEVHYSGCNFTGEVSYK